MPVRFWGQFAIYYVEVFWDMTTPICRFVVVGFGMAVFGVFIDWKRYLLGLGAGLVLLEWSGLILGFAVGIFD